MAKAQIILTNEESNKLVTKADIFNALSAQQDAYMERKGLEAPVAKVRALKRYARLCWKAFKANRKACVSERDHKRLAKALAKRLKLTARKPEFLNAVAA